MFFYFLRSFLRLAHEIATAYRLPPGITPFDVRGVMLLTSNPSRWRTAIVGTLMATASWLPSVMAADKTQADYYVQSLPGAPEGPLLKMHAG